MNCTNDFKKLIDICIEHNQYLGLGNPEAKILFVGKEAGSPVDSGLKHGNGLNWRENKYEYAKRFRPVEKNMNNNNHTWQKYQKLYELILNRLDIKEDQLKEDYEISFVENVFTTELSNLPAPKSSEAKKLNRQHP